MRSSNASGMGTLFVCALLSIACSSPGEDSEDGVTDVLQEAIYNNYTTPNPVYIRGIARRPCTSSNLSPRTYTWFSYGKVCQGRDSFNDVDLCSHSIADFVMPSNVGGIAAVGISHNSGHVYAWFTNSTVSEGTSTNLSAYNEPRSFTPAVNPDDPEDDPFRMGDLLDADISDNGRVYYYWQVSANDPVYRTIGTSRNATSHSQPVEVQKSSTGLIRGISFYDQVLPGGPGEPDFCQSAVGARSIETWYTDGRVNRSTSSLNLDQ